MHTSKDRAEPKVIILAGGAGRRLWPLSSPQYPKYLMEFEGRTLLQQAYTRVDIPDENKYIIGAGNVAVLIKRDLLEINNNFSDKNLLLEPLSKNTAPAAALGISILDKEDIAVILPADHIIKPSDEFNRSLRDAVKLAAKGHIAVIGINPEHPATGYGYIKKGEELDSGWKVVEFKEKPDAKTAQEYLKSGNYLWNAGIYVFNVSVMREEMDRYAGYISRAFSELKADRSNLKEIYKNMPGISIDYAVMEKTDRAAVTAFKGYWKDLGSWKTVKEEPRNSGEEKSKGDVRKNEW